VKDLLCGSARYGMLYSIQPLFNELNVGLEFGFRNTLSNL